MMEKRRTFLLIGLLAALFCIGAMGCKKKVEDPLANLTPSQIIDGIYDNLSTDVELPGLATTEINAENMAYYLGTTDIPMKEGAASEPLINAIPFSLCVVRLNDGEDRAAVEKRILENANPRKWICVMVEDQNVIVDGSGDIVVLIMAEQSEALQTAFRKTAGVS